MSALKLAQLPDRVPVKLAIMVQPELKKALDDYALLYARNYGAEESVVELIPYMLEAFLKADAAFRTGRKELRDVPSLPIARRKSAKGGKSTDPNNKEGN
jgi:hypothetical protein